MPKPAPRRLRSDPLCSALICGLALLGSGLPGGALEAQTPAPVLLEVHPPGGTPGESVKVRLVGKQLEDATAILFDAPGLSARLLPPPEPAPPDGSGSEKERDKDRKKESPPTLWEVVVDASVPPGLYDLRVVSPSGISAPRAFHIERTPILEDKDPREDKPVELSGECRIDGLVEESWAERFRWTADRAGPIVLECLGAQIDSKLDPVLEVRDASGRRVASSGNVVSLDPILSFEAEAGAVYHVTLWDFTYRGPFPYLLSIARRPRILMAYPPVVTSAAPAALLGWCLPGSRNVGGARGSIELLEVEAGVVTPIAATGAGGFHSFRPTESLHEALVDARARGIDAAPFPMLDLALPAELEVEPNDRAELATRLTLPAVVCGRFEPVGDVDIFAFRARKGEAIEVEVSSARLGAPCDPVFTVGRLEPARDARPAFLRELASVDERKTGFPTQDGFDRKFSTPTRDPVLVWSSPEDGEYLVSLRNRNRRGGADAIYTLQLRPAAPGFSLAVIHSENYGGEGLAVPRGGSQSYDLLLERQGTFDGEVQVSVEGLPAGLEAKPVHIAPRETFAPLVIAAAGDAASWAGFVHVVGEASWQGVALRREARGAFTVYGGAQTQHPLQATASRWMASIPLCVREPLPFTLRLEPQGLVLPPGAKTTFKVVASRVGGFTEPIGIAFHGAGETAYPDGEGKRNAKSTIAKDASEATVELQIKNNLPYGDRTCVAYASAQISMMENPADPKSKSRQQRATVTSNAITVRIAPPVVLRPEPIADALPAGGALRLPFRLERLEGVEGDVEVSLDGLKSDRALACESVRLGKDQSSGELILRSALDGPPGDLEALQLRARVSYAGRNFDDTTALAGPLRRVAPLAVLLAGDLPSQLPRAARFQVPFRIERRADVEGKLSVTLRRPAGFEGLETKPVTLDDGILAGALEVQLTTAASDLSGLELEAILEKGGKQARVATALPVIHVRSRLRVAAPELARFGAIRLSLGRSPDLEVGTPLELRVRATGPGGGESSTAVRFAAGDVEVGLLLDAAALAAGARDESPFPIRLQLAYGPAGSETVEEHILQGQ